MTDIQQHFLKVEKIFIENNEVEWCGNYREHSMVRTQVTNERVVKMQNVIPIGLSTLSHFILGEHTVLELGCTISLRGVVP